MAREREFVIPREMYQVRVAPKLGWFYSNKPIYFDSKLIFFQKSLATKYIAYYIRGLKEDGILKQNAKLDAWIVTLTVYDKGDVKGDLENERQQQD